MANLQEVKKSYQEIKKEGFNGEKLLKWIKEKYAPFVGGIMGRLKWEKNDDYNNSYLDNDIHDVEQARLRSSSRRQLFQKHIDECTSDMQTQRGTDLGTAQSNIRIIGRVYGWLSSESESKLKDEVEFYDILKKQSTTWTKEERM